MSVFKPKIARNFLLQLIVLNFLVFFISDVAKLSSAVRVTVHIGLHKTNYPWIESYSSSRFTLM